MSTVQKTSARFLFIACVTAGIATLGLVAPAAQEPAVVVHDAWARPPLPSKDETAVYLTIENRSAAKRAVVSVMSEQAKVAEMHNMSMDGKLMKMTQLQQIVVPANGTAVLKPNGMHVMLMGLTTKPAVGDTLNLTLKLDDGTMVPFKADIRK